MPFLYSNFTLFFCFFQEVSARTEQIRIHCTPKVQNRKKLPPLFRLEKPILLCYLILSVKRTKEEKRKRMGKKVYCWMKKEKVLCIAALCALLTMVFVPPDGSYAAYIDFRVLCLLLCLMAVVAGFQHCGAFRWVSAALLKKSGNGRILSVTLVMLPFFTAMLVTNDVSLLTFVPFTLLLLEQIGCRKAAVPILVLQTIAANLGSMATPVGNPQNLFLYTAYELSPAEFFSAMLPLTALSFVCLFAAALPVETAHIEYRHHKCHYCKYEPKH